MPKPYKPKIPYPQRLRKVKMEAQYGKFLNMIRAVRVNIPLVDVLAGMPNYEDSKVPLILGRPFLYTVDTVIRVKQKQLNLGIETKRMTIPIGIVENMLVKVGKFTFPVDFVILEMEEDSKIPHILGRPFLYITDAVIRVKQKQLNLRVGTDGFSIP
ncbi:reverse transcriptase domain-containing protein [Tanacetum coccineum]|uniref:Reverse transcriptase domain-containing protein n=1 Tax=Tanacetum coccineum TaxID=301880 RepID=A0ABQ4WGQ3_9ASTR